MAEVCFYRGVFFRPKKTKSPMKELSMGFPWQDLEKVSDATVHRSGDMGRLEKNWPDRRSAGGGGRLAKSLGSKKKVACRVWLVRCSLYVREGGSRVGYWRGVNVAGHSFGTSRFAMRPCISSGHGVCRGP